MYKHQATMAKLPVPDLQATCAKYLRSVRALVSDAHYERTKAAVEEFLKPGGQGEVLQKRLLEHSQNTLTDWSQVVVGSVDGKPHPNAGKSYTSWYSLHSVCIMLDADGVLTLSSRVKQVVG